MKNYTKMIAGVLFALAISFGPSAFSAETVNAGNVVVSEKSTVKSTSLFNAGEVGLSLGTGYVVDRAAPFQNDYSFNLTAGAFYFPFRYLGVEANVPFYQTSGVSVSEVQAGLLLRLPLSTSVPVFKNLAPYIGVGEVYNWKASDKWAYVAKAGVDVRLNSKWGVFVEGQYRNDEFSNWQQGSTTVQGGLKLVF